MSEITPAFAFLLTRRSRPGKLLQKPVPDMGTLQVLLRAACRVPDHGKLEPWRFIVLPEKALRRLAAPARARAQACGADPDKAAGQFEIGHLAVAVIESPKPSENIPEIEQTYSAGAVCLGLVNAALAAGWGAAWLSGFASHDREFCQSNLGLAAHERVAGIVHIGTYKEPVPDRPRPNVAAITKIMR